MNKVIKLGGIFYENDYDDHYSVIRDNRNITKIINTENKKQIKEEIENLMNI